MRLLMALLVASLAWACSGAPADGGDGGTGQDGGPPTVTIQFQSACTGFTPCASSPAGTFDYTAGCVDDPFPELKQACGTITVSGMTGTARGRVTFASPSVTRDVTVTVSGTVNVPAACKVTTCAAIASALGSSYQSPSCVDAGGGCSCTLTRKTSAASGSATYAISGSRLSITDGSTTRHWDICLSGGTLQHREVTTPIGEPGIWTLTKR